ncbi:uncharacterized protein N7496_007575 [Penicillium cataractarum]|uniref:Transmembrane protein n=1 Tax=Penicillium cataractarum TaxID=2100454 RepID=A0A9W9V774_9EURO|nr:uncharacterized protein N7496_007575 [Penicillium cataractarum]KAJ5371483.1 hypothetical protein N7496_007575 [Penicillium cataractarum]
MGSRELVSEHQLPRECTEHALVLSLFGCHSDEMRCIFCFKSSPACVICSAISRASTTPQQRRSLEHPWFILRLSFASVQVEGVLAQVARLAPQQPATQRTCTLINGSAAAPLPSPSLDCCCDVVLEKIAKLLAQAEETSPSDVRVCACVRTIFWSVALVAAALQIFGLYVWWTEQDEEDRHVHEE